MPGAAICVHVLGRSDGVGPSAHLGHYRARDGSRGARVGLDLSGPHVVAIVGKRGSGKSYTLGVIAEALAGTPGVVPVVVDAMGAVGTLPDARWPEPTVAAGTIPPQAWPDLLDLDPAGGPGALVWRAAAATTSFEGMRSYVSEVDAPRRVRLAARNHLDLAATWDVFGPAGVTGDIQTATLLDLTGLAAPPANAVVRGLAAGAFEARVRQDRGPLPWLLVDEAHVFLSGVAGPALRRILTRGRAPGVSLVLATQRPADLPEVVTTQADLLVAHELTGADRRAFLATRPDALAETTEHRAPREPGQALIVDDATAAVHAVTVRERRATHGGGSPRVGTVGERRRE